MSDHRSAAFLHRLVPELTLFENERDAAASWKKAKIARPPWVFALLIVGIVFVGSLVWFTAVRLFAMPQWAGTFSMWVGTSCYSILLSAYIGHYFWREPMRREIRADLQAAGVPICVACGHDLRGHEAACPPHHASPCPERIACYPESVPQCPEQIACYPESVALRTEHVARCTEHAACCPECGEPFDEKLLPSQRRRQA